MATPPSIRKLVHQLNQHYLVYKAVLTYHEIQVRYHNGLVEHWLRGDSPFLKQNCWVYSLPDDFGEVDDDLDIKYEFEINPLDDTHILKKKYFKVKAEDYKKASFVAQRLMVHKLINKLLRSGFIKLQYPDEALLDDFVKFRSDNLDRFNRSGTSRIYASYGMTARPPGQKILEHFVPCGRYDGLDEIKKVWRRPFNLYSSITYLMRTGQDLTRSAVHRDLIYGIIPPSFYRHVFNKFDIKNFTIADPNPRSGSKALAAVACDCDYHYQSSSFGDYADKLASFLGVEFKNVNARDAFDVVILDFNWKDSSDIFRSIEKWRSIGDMLIVYVHRNTIDEVEDKYPPIQKISIDAKSIYGDESNYLLLI